MASRVRIEDRGGKLDGLVAVKSLQIQNGLNPYAPERRGGRRQAASSVDAVRAGGASCVAADAAAGANTEPLLCLDLSR